MMKTSAVSLAVWCAQVLMLCAFHEDLLTTQELDVSTMNSEQLTTNQDVRTKITTIAAMTTTVSAAELLSVQTSPMTPIPELSSFTSLMEDDRRNNTVSTSHHNIMSLTDTSVSTNTTSALTEDQETGTNTENTSINIQETTEISTSRMYMQLDHDLQTTTSTSWKEDRTSDTDEATTTTMPLVYLTYETNVTVTSGSYDTTDHHLTTAGTHVEILSTNQTASEDTTNTVTPAGTLGSINVTEPTVHSAQVTSGSAENTEEHLVSTTDMMDWKTEENTEALVTTQGNVYNNMTNTTWTDETLSRNTEDAWSINTTMSTSEMESTTDMMDWITEENTEALTMTQGNMYNNTTNTTWSDETWSANTEDTWSTNTTTSKNISTSETETPHWTHCFTKDSSPQPRRISKLVCFITMWTLGMITSIFLGLTVFLWVRLSIRKKRARLRGRGWTGRNGKGPVEKEKESLWVEPDSSAEERVEFWYASGATVEEDRRRHRARQVKMRQNGERQTEEEDMWIQPKVTLKDITEFWYANGRVRHNEGTRCEVNEERETEIERESGGERHTE